MTFWTYRDVPYSLRKQANNSDWRWTVDYGEGVYLTGVCSSDAIDPRTDFVRQKVFHSTRRDFFSC